MSGFRIGRSLLLAVVALLTLAGFALSDPTILSPDNLSSMAVFAVELGIIAFGQGLVIEGGDGSIDLSVGAISGLAQILVAQAINAGIAWPLAILGGVAVGLLMGCINAFAITRLRIPAIIATLGTMFAYSGFALVVCDGTTIDLTSAPATFLAIGQSKVIGVPFQILCLYLPLLAVLIFVQHRSRFGRSLYLVGTNAIAAHLAGLRIARLRGATYLISGTLAAIAGVIAAARLGTATPDGVPDANLISIAIVVLGGASIFGGDGSPVGTMVATVTIAIADYGLNYDNFNPTYQAGLMGVILVAVVLLENLYRGGAVQSFLGSRRRGSSAGKQ